MAVALIRRLKSAIDLDMEIIICTCIQYAERQPLLWKDQLMSEHLVLAFISKCTLSIWTKCTALYNFIFFSIRFWFKIPASLFSSLNMAISSYPICRPSRPRTFVKAEWIPGTDDKISDVQQANPRASSKIPLINTLTPGIANPTAQANIQRSQLRQDPPKAFEIPRNYESGIWTTIPSRRLSRVEGPKLPRWGLIDSIAKLQRIADGVMERLAHKEAPRVVLFPDAPQLVRATLRLHCQVMENIMF